MQIDLFLLEFAIEQQKEAAVQVITQVLCNIAEGTIELEYAEDIARRAVAEALSNPDGK